LKPLTRLILRDDDFPPEPLPIDGTLLHALERIIPFAAAEAGFDYATTYVRSSKR
jgi:lipopolysaccharide biosynthesis protein